MQNLRLNEKKIKFKCSTSLKRSGYVESKIGDLEKVLLIIVSKMYSTILLKSVVCPRLICKSIIKCESCNFLSTLGANTVKITEANI